jgi:hypothetical protein
MAGVSALFAERDGEPLAQGLVVFGEAPDPVVGGFEPA